MDRNQDDLIERLAPGMTLWFTSSARAGLEGYGNYAEDGFVYCGTVSKVVLESFQSYPPQKGYSVWFDDDTESMYFRTGGDGSFNKMIFLSREDAEKSIRVWYLDSLKQEEEDFEIARKRIQHYRNRVAEPIVAVPIRHSSRSYFESVIEDAAIDETTPAEMKATIHECARALLREGTIDDKKMAEFDRLCLQVES